MGEWQELVRDAILEMTSGHPGAHFTRKGLIDHSMPTLQEAFPAAKTPAQTLSRELQDLRDRGEIEFVARGEYRLLVKGDEADQIERRPGKRPGTRGVRRSEIKTRPYQFWLRSQVIPNFGHRCAVCGLTPEWFLDAAHLRPATQFLDLAGDPTAAVALCKNHHQALDVGALIIGPDLRLEVRKLAIEKRSAELARVLLEYDGARLRRPRHWRLNREALPSLGSLRIDRED